MLNPQKSPYKAVPEAGGWRGAAGRANRKPGLPAGKSRAAGCLRAWHCARPAPPPAPLSLRCSVPWEGSSQSGVKAFLLCRIRLSEGFMRWWEYSSRETTWSTDGALWVASSSAAAQLWLNSVSLSFPLGKTMDLRRVFLSCCERAFLLASHVPGRVEGSFWGSCWA